ncbi:MAG TPA: hypothetical protein VJT84_03885 [Gaiellaceae bacterium]|nr:hypothetical protein [Gaiellaceae bacterium]
MPAANPYLHQSLRAFCLAAFARLGSQAGELPFVLEQRGTSFYEYRPLVRDHVEARSGVLAALPDAAIALEELRREPAAAVFCRAGSSDDRALFRAILLPLLVRTAEACGGFDWDDGAFDHVYGEFVGALVGEERAYGAVAPLVGLSVAAPIELARGMRVVRTSSDELRGRWPESVGMLPARFGLEPERSCVLELERRLSGTAQVPDVAADFADAVTALRLATAAPVAAGPVAFERLAWHPLGIRPLIGIAASEPPGEATRLDVWRGGLAAEILDRLAAAEDDSSLGEALERWELALFEGEPLRSERLREAIAALLGGADGLWAATMRASVLLGDTDQRLRALGRGDRAALEVAEDVRHAIVETLLHEDRDRLLVALDDALLGLRAPPPGYYAARAATG